MDFSSKQQNEGKWCWFNGHDASDGGLCLRVMSIDESRRISKIVTKSKHKPIKGQVVKIDEVDEELKDRLTWDYCITAWKDVKLDGKLLECNADNKVKMMKHNLFAAFFIDRMAELNDELETTRELQEKNSKTSSSGSAPQIVETA
jgi:hypothetical protein